MIGWVVILVLAGGTAALVNQGLDRDITIPGTESQEALDSLARTFPQVSGTSAQILVVAPDGADVTTQEYRDAVASTVSDLEEMDQVEQVVSPFDSTVTGAVSDDLRAAIIRVQMSGDLGDIRTDTETQLRAETAALLETVPEGSEVTLGGQLFTVVLPHVTATEGIGVLLALAILFVTFGSLLAAGMPLLIALLGVGVSTALIFVGTSFTAINSTTPVLSLMLGLAVGIDYSLFIISRHREQLAAGIDPEESIARSTATSGSAVVFAGITVIVALLGLSVAGIPFLTTMGVAAAVGVAVAVAASLTFLPALLAVAGGRLRPRERKRPRTRRAGDSRVEAFYRGWVRTATRRPIVTIITVVVIVGAAAIPAMGLRLALPNAGTLPTENEARQTYDRISEHFGEGYNATLILTGSVLQSTDPVGLMDALGEEIAGLDGVASVPLSTPNATGDTGIVQIIPEGSPNSQVTQDLVTELRDLHDHFLDEYGIDTSVTGQTAVQLDVSTKLAGSLLPFGALVVGLSLVLLMAVFRSIWVPLKATLGYLLSLVAAFGAVALVFEDGVLADALHVTSLGPVISFMPIIVMGILFGLAMDYELFLVSRIREEYVHGADAATAVERGFLGSARVVTAAALIMFSVFAAFVPEGDTTIKPMALALAVGVFVDAFVVRMTLVPAVLKLLGDRAWWIPRWLDRLLPVLDVEGESLSHEIALRDWPSADDTHAIAVEDVPLEGEDVDRPIRWTARVEPGTIHVIEAADARVGLSALRTATGRRATRHGKAKVLGRVLPAGALHVRSSSVLIDAARVSDVSRALTRALSEKPSLVAVAGLDRLLPEEKATLLAALAARLQELTVLIATTDAASLPLPGDTPVSVSRPSSSSSPTAQEQFA